MVYPLAFQQKTRMKTMLVKAVIFDLDGTLASFNLPYKTVRALVKAYLVSKGVPASILSVNESVFEMLRKTETWANNSGKPEKFWEDIRNGALAITEKYELEAASSTSLLPGVTETLKVLRDKGSKIGLCTINSEKSVNCILDRFGIAGLFDVTVSRNQVKRVKPHPEHLEAALKVLGASPQEALVVGDASVDMQSAKELKAIAVGLPTGVSTVDQLMSGGADYILTSISDLPILIDSINKIRKENTKDEKEKL
jgi:HAD superfamily hydrolase (TIGR01509 family)